MCREKVVTDLSILVVDYEVEALVFIVHWENLTYVERNIPAEPMVLTAMAFSCPHINPIARILLAGSLKK